MGRGGSLVNNWLPFFFALPAPVDSHSVIVENLISLPEKVPTALHSRRAYRSGKLVRLLCPRLVPNRRWASTPHRAGPLPLQRGQQLPHLRQDGSPPRHPQWPGGRRLQRVGAERAVRLGRRQLQWMGSQDASPQLRAAPPASGKASFPASAKGALYKFHIESNRHGYRVDKADPLGLLHEKPPRTASVVWDLDYQWNDQRMDAEARRAAIPCARRRPSTKSISARGCAFPKSTTAR